MHRFCAALITTIALATPSAHAQTKAIAARSPTRSAKKTADALSVLGVVLLAAGYVPSFVMGAISLGDGITHIQILCSDNGGFGGACRHNDAVALIIPLVGPALYASPSARDHVFRPDGAPSSGELTLLYTEETLQVGGLGLLFAAMIYRVASIPDAPLATAPLHANTWSLTPECAVGRLSLGATYRF